MGKFTHLTDGGHDDFDDIDDLLAAARKASITAGDYKCKTVEGKLGKSRNGNPCYTVSLEVVDGPCAGYRLFKDFFLTPKALNAPNGSAQKLEKIGITSGQQMKSPLPLLGVVARVVIENDDSGFSRSKVVDLVIDVELTRRLKAEAIDPFAAGAEGGDDGAE